MKEQTHERKENGGGNNWSSLKSARKHTQT